MIQIEKFLLIIGNARSGSTILGAVLDAHPNIVVANETIESGHLWRGLDGEKILAGIFQNAEQQALESTRSAVCGQKSAWPPSKKQDIRVMGDKIWNPATLFLHGKYNLIPSLEERVVAPVALIHACRNPFRCHFFVAFEKRRSSWRPDPLVFGPLRSGRGHQRAHARKQVSSCAPRGVDSTPIGSARKLLSIPRCAFFRCVSRAMQAVAPRFPTTNPAASGVDLPGD